MYDEPVHVPLNLICDAEIADAQFIESAEFSRERNRRYFIKVSREPVKFCNHVVAERAVKAQDVPRGSDGKLYCPLSHGLPVAPLDFCERNGFFRLGCGTKSSPRGCGELPSEIRVAEDALQHLKHKRAEGGRKLMVF